MEVKNDTCCECPSDPSVHSPQNQKVPGQWIEPVRPSSKHSSSDRARARPGGGTGSAFACCCPPGCHSVLSPVNKRSDTEESPSSLVPSGRSQQRDFAALQFPENNSSEGDGMAHIAPSLPLRLPAQSRNHPWAWRNLTQPAARLQQGGCVGPVCRGHS